MKKQPDEAVGYDTLYSRCRKSPIAKPYRGFWSASYSLAPGFHPADSDIEHLKTKDKMLKKPITAEHLSRCWNYPIDNTSRFASSDHEA